MYRMLSPPPILYKYSPPLPKCDNTADIVSTSHISCTTYLYPFPCSKKLKVAQLFCAVMNSSLYRYLTRTSTILGSLKYDIAGVILGRRETVRKSNDCLRYGTSTCNVNAKPLYYFPERELYYYYILTLPLLKVYPTPSQHRN